MRSESKRRRLLKTKGIKLASKPINGKELNGDKQEGQRKVSRGKKVTETRRVK